MKVSDFLKIFLIFILVIRTRAQDEEEDDDESEESVAFRSVRNANNKFGIDYYNALRESYREDNLVFSPYSMSVLLALLGSGARGETKKEMKSVLRLKSTIADDTMSEGYSELISGMPDTEDSGFQSIQRIYLPSTHSLRQSFKDKLEENYASPEAIKNMDFAQSASAALKINNWINKTTQGKIDSIISADVLSKKTQLVLLSSVNFHGKWETTFKSSKDEPFYSTNGRTFTNVSMLYQAGRFKYADLADLNARAVSVQYGGDRLELVILLPKETVNGIRELEAKLTNVSLATIYPKMRTSNLALSFPEFTMESFLPFSNKSPVLSKIGLQAALAHQLLQFNGITPWPGLYIDQINQKTLFSVSAEGVDPEALERTGPPPSKEIKFEVNRPFIGFLYDRESKSVLLVARKVN